MDDDDDIVETKPSILNLLNRLYEQPFDDLPNETDHQSVHSPSPVDTLNSSIGIMPSDIRTTLEDRFLDYVKQYRCFYDHNDKHFVHNQYKSNIYGIIAKKLNAEGLQTTGSQLATLFKSMKAKYRDENRRLSRTPELEPSPFYLKFQFMEAGLNSVDQRLAKFRTTTNGHQKSASTAKTNSKERYASAVANVLERFTPEMKDNFLKFITALNDLKEPVKHLENFTRVAKELKTRPDSSVEIAKSSSTSNDKTSQKTINSALGDLAPDLESMGQTFEDQKDLLALFRVLGNVITKLPAERRHSHLQGLLNISSAALNAPVQISWQSEVYQPVEKQWTIANNTITIDGPSPNDSIKFKQKEQNVEVVPPESTRTIKRKYTESDDEDNQSDISTTTNETSATKTDTSRRLPRAAKERNFVTHMSPVKRPKRR